MTVQVFDHERIDGRIENVIARTIACGYKLDEYAADVVVRLSAALLPEHIRVKVDTPRLRGQFQGLFDFCQCLSLVKDDDEWVKSRLGPGLQAVVLVRSGVSMRGDCVGELSKGCTQKWGNRVRDPTG
jgi:hypothetical protein